VFTFYVGEVTRRHVYIQGRKLQRRRWLAIFDITIHNRYKDRRYLQGYLLMFQFGL